MKERLIVSKLCRLIILGTCVFIYSCGGPSPDVEINGDEVKIQIQDHHLLLKKTADLDESGMLFGFTLAPAEAYFNGIMSFITMDRVESLRARYPDFYQCSSPGADSAKEYVESVILIAADSQVAGKLRKINNLFKTTKKRIVVKAKGLKLVLQDYKIEKGGEEFSVPAKARSKDLHYFIREIEYEEKGL